MTLRGKNVLVTGGAGFIGSHLVDRIARENPANLVVVDNFFLGSEGNLADARRAYGNLKLFRIDASDLAAMHQLIASQKIEVAFDLAVIPLPTSLSYPAWTIETNVGIATTLCELARWGSLQTLVHCSSSEAYGTAMYTPMDESHPLLPSTPYAASKVSADHVVLSYFLTFQIDAVIVRPFNNFGPRQNPGTYAGIIPIIVNRVRRGEPVEIHGDGEQTRDFIYAPHTADAIVRIHDTAATRGKVINIATGHETSINTLVAMLLDVLGVPQYPVRHTPPRPGDVRRHCGDVRMFRELIGFEPPAISRADLAETVDWYLRSTSA